MDHDLCRLGHVFFYVKLGKTIEIVQKNGVIKFSGYVLIDRACRFFGHTFRPLADGWTDFWLNWRTRSFGRVQDKNQQRLCTTPGLVS